MSGPKRLWSGDWMTESAAARARMARHRGDVAEPETLEAQAPPPPPAPVAPEPPPPRAAPRPRWGAALAARRAGLPRLGLRSRLVLIAVLAGAIGAGAMVGVEAATGAGGTSASAYLGVELGPSALGPSGALVEAVYAGSPAAAAGIVVGDVITSIGGRAVVDSASAAAAMAAQRPGALVTVAIERLGQPLALRVTLGSRPSGSP